MVKMINPKLKEAVKRVLPNKEALLKYMTEVLIPLVDDGLKSHDEVDIDANYPITWVYNKGFFANFNEKPLSEKFEIRAKEAGFNLEGDGCWIATNACADLLGMVGKYKVAHQTKPTPRGYNYTVVSRAGEIDPVLLDEIALELYKN